MCNMKKKEKIKIQLRDLQRMRYMYDFLTGQNDGAKFIKIKHISWTKN